MWLEIFLIGSFPFLFCLRNHVIVLDVPIVLDVIVFDTGLLVVRICLSCLYLFVVKTLLYCSVLKTGPTRWLNRVRP